jgi:hypothetical protein
MSTVVGSSCKVYFKDSDGREIELGKACKFKLPTLWERIINRIKFYLSGEYKKWRIKGKCTAIIDSITINEKRGEE